MAFAEKVAGLMRDNRNDLVDSAVDMVDQHKGVVVVDPVADIDGLRDAAKKSVRVESIGGADINGGVTAGIFRKFGRKDDTPVRKKFVQRGDDIRLLLSGKRGGVQGNIAQRHQFVVEFQIGAAGKVDIEILLLVRRIFICRAVADCDIAEPVSG